jgi:hypothetical protein
LNENVATDVIPTKLIPEKNKFNPEINRVREIDIVNKAMHGIDLDRHLQ